jgi:hypothetical protein
MSGWGLLIEMYHEITRRAEAHGIWVYDFSLKSQFISVHVPTKAAMAEYPLNVNPVSMIR